MIIYYIFLMIRIMHVLCTGINCVAEDNFPLTMFEMLFIYLFIYAWVIKQKSL